MQTTEQKGINARFESIMNVLQTIQTSQKSSNKRTRSPTTEIDPLPNHKKPAFTCNSPLDLDSMDVHIPQTQRHPDASLTVTPIDHPPDCK